MLQINSRLIYSILIKIFMIAVNLCGSPLLFEVNTSANTAGEVNESVSTGCGSRQRTSIDGDAKELEQQEEGS